MPDVSRSDSQRSDASHKPRVSFNRDVHVKRIGREGVVSALAGDGEGHLVPLAVRRERPGRLSRRELEKEAEAILRQADRVRCTPDLGPDKFSTLPPRPRPKHSGHQPVSSIFNSLDRRGKKKKPLEAPDGSGGLQRRYSNPDNFWRAQTPQKPSPPEVPQRRKLNRSVSDAGRREESGGGPDNRSSIFGTLERLRKKKKPPSLPEREDVVLPPVRKKKQLSPIIEMSPKVEADAFRFSNAAPTPPRQDTQDTVVYAEVVARPSGKTTVHTAVPTDPSSRPEHGSEEDEGVDMGHRGLQIRRSSYDSDLLRSTLGDMKPKKRDDDIREDKIINMLRSKSNPLLDEELVGGYRREYRTERVIRVEGADDPDGRGRADGMDFSTRRRSSKDLIEEVPLKNSYQTQSFDELDRIKYQEPIRAWTPPLETSLIDSNNLSYRRDRLESRLTNQKRWFPSATNDSKKHRGSKGEDLRKDFLISQMNGHIDKEKGYFERKIATEIDTHHRQQLLKNKDVFADSGIEMSDYRKESSNNVASLNRKNVEVSRTIKTENTRTKSSPTVHKIDYHSDGEKRYKGDISARFVEEERRRRDVIPTSTALVKNYVKPVKNDSNKTFTKKDESIVRDKKKEKLSRMDKVKQLMFGTKDAKKSKAKKKVPEEEEDLLRSRYTEYKGSDVSLNSSPVIQRRRQTSSSEVDDRTDQELEFYGSRQRLATPSPSLRATENKSEDTWFKSLTRRNKKSEKKHKAMNGHNGHSEDSLRSQQSNKTLRFFGDSDRDSLQSARVSSPLLRDSSPSYKQRAGRRHIIAADSSAESTAEESNHSQKSVVYLHAATVGDIPGSRKLHRSVIGGRRSMSREELSSNQEPITPQSRTLSRSISVLAPWRPKHNRQEVNYDSGGKPPKPPKLKKPLEIKKLDPKDKNEKSKKSNRDLRRSKENLIDYKEPRRGSESVLSDHRRSRGNLVFVGKRENYSDVESSNMNGTSTLGRTHHTIDRSHRTNRLSDKSRDLSRSISIPKDSKVSSGWFRGKQHI